MAQFKKIVALSAGVAFCLFAFSAYGLQPPTKEQIAEYNKDGTWQKRVRQAYRFGNHKMSPQLIQRADYKTKILALQSMDKTSSDVMTVMAPPPAWQGMPTTGDVKMFVLLIEFDDYDHLAADDQVSVDASIFGPENTAAGNYPYESLSAYYDRSSYGLLNLQGATLGWYNPGGNRSDIAETDTARENLIKQALNAFDAGGHDFSQYDNDGDGAIDYFAVIWTGPHGEWASFWWAYQTWFGDSSYLVDGKSLGKYSWQWESYSYPDGQVEPLVLIHETGHALGLPDYYDYQTGLGPEGGVGGLDMMDSNWGDHNAFSKFVLDWITPTVITEPGSSQSLSLSPSSTSGDAILVMPGATGGIFDQYFMVQYRKREKNDLDHPTDGLTIWHVDAQLDAYAQDYLYDNSYTEHKLLRLMEADSLEEIEQNLSADEGDFYAAGDVFANYTTPNSKKYDGEPSGLVVDNISAAGTTILADIALASTPSIEIISPAQNTKIHGQVTVSAQVSSPLPITGVEFFANGTSLGVDTAAPYSMDYDTAGTDYGSYTFTAVATASNAMTDSDETTAYFVTSAIKALVYDLKASNQSGERIGETLAHHNILPVFSTTIAATDPGEYPAVFVLLGYYPGNYMLGSTDSAYLAAYLDAGGQVYMEGGDTWAFDTRVPVHDYFGISGISDGQSDLASVAGLSGTFTEGLTLTSTWPGQGWVDRITAETGAINIWENSSYDYSYYCGVANTAAGYQTIGVSFEFGDLTDNDEAYAVLDSYLSFFSVKHGMPDPGDVNNDGTIDLQDTILSLQVMTGSASMPIDHHSDVNGDSRIGLAETIFTMKMNGQATQ